MTFLGAISLAGAVLMVGVIFLLAAATLPTERGRNIAWGLGVAFCLIAIIALPHLVTVLIVAAIVVLVGVPTGISMSKQAS